MLFMQEALFYSIQLEYLIEQKVLSPKQFDFLNIIPKIL